MKNNRKTITVIARSDNDAAIHASTCSGLLRRARNNKKRTIAFWILVAGFFLLATTPARAEQDGIFTVTLSEAEQTVSRALEKEGAADYASASITSSRLATLYRYNRAIAVDVKTLKFDESKEQFSANLYFMDGEDVISVLPVSGRYEEMIPLPVARHRMTHNDTVALEDLDEVLYPAARMRKDTALSATDIVGKSPVRAISAGRPIRLSELKAPAVLQKGAKVQMRFHTPYMIISTLGEALEDGAEGERIRVRNFESGAIVQAQVASGSEVYVGKRPFIVE